MFKTAVFLEETGKVQIVALDKTGTITSGEPKVTDVIPDSKIAREELLEIAYALEKKSEHPLAKAILSYAKEQKVPDGIEVSEFQAVPGNGLSGLNDGENLTGGNLNFIRQHAEVSENVEAEARKLADQGKTPLFFARNGRFLGMIAVADVIKEDSPQAVQELQNMGIRVVMLTGDNELVETYGSLDPPEFILGIYL